ncbi:hypothetical protein D9K79_00845 [Acinetobacter cumulans]|uniref:DUF1983 domain-containing protein n=1 Tax=Acinetobacter cumulans TaxID=2136182 RepID=A0ABX9UAV5_9GAMM|nr:hypothetical protein [Acinetobacter cumulans]RLL50330.1 hypothetical protein D9K79_00845 [Acinetobacter cumulans]
MSNYRDDTIETVIVSDYSWLNHAFIVDESVSVSDKLLVGVGSVTIESVAVEDSAVGFSGYMAHESISVEDSAFGFKHAVSLCIEKVSVRDSLLNSLFDVVHEEVALSDQIFGYLRSQTAESVTVEDSIFGQRTASSLTVERISVRDSLFGYASDLAVDSISVDDDVFSKKHAFSFFEESVSVSDAEITRTGMTDLVIESVTLNSEAFGKLAAVQQANDSVHVYDVPLFETLQRQAWVARSDTWAMSRYAPFNYEGCAVINGNLIVWDDAGVYQEQAQSNEVIHAKVDTGRLAFADGLTHPLMAYFEYALQGAQKKIELSITTTQSGSPQSYKYTMPAERSDYLTNGRIQFGRGLRGSHFSLGLEMYGTAAEVSSLSIEYTNTARRT